MPGVDAEPLGELAVRQAPLRVLAEHLQRPQAQRVPERLQLLRAVDDKRVLHPWELRADYI